MDLMIRLTLPLDAMDRGATAGHPEWSKAYWRLAGLDPRATNRDLIMSMLRRAISGARQ